MRALNLFLPLVLVFFIASCDSGNIEEKPNIEILDLKEILNLQEEEVMMSSFFDGFEYIRPESKQGSYFTLMGIQHIGSEIIILFEKKTSQSYIFSREGKFISKLGEVGKGPGEYKSASGVFVFNKFKEIHISDRERKQLLRFNFNGLFINNIPYDIPPKKLSVYQDSLYICAYSNEDIYENNGKDLIIRHPITFDEVDVLWDRKGELTKNKSYDQPTDLCSFRKINDHLSFIRTTPSGDFIYEITDNTVKPKYSIVYGELPYNECAGIGGPEKVFLSALRNVGNNIQIAIQKEFNITTGYFDIEDKSWKSMTFINDLDKGITFYPMGATADGGYHSDDIKIHYFKEFWEDKRLNGDYQKIEAKYPDREKWLKETIPTAENDNPWIMVVYPKVK